VIVRQPLSTSDESRHCQQQNVSRVGVIGAGPAGLTAALSLVRGGAEVEVFEATNQVGGLCQSVDLWGRQVDIGPHRFFSTDRRVNEFWLESVGDQYEMIDRLTRIYFRGKMIDYPIRPLNVMRQLGPVEAGRCLLSYLRQKLLVGSTSNDSEACFESWVTNRFGRRLFEVFFRSYSEKLWGIPCSELSADFATQRIRQFSLREVLRNAMPGNRSRHRTLVDRFAYPIGGTGVVYNNIAEQIRNLGGTIHTNTPIRHVARDNSTVAGIMLESGETKEFDHVISTMPLTKLIHGLRSTEHEVPADVLDAADNLTFRNTLLVYLHIDSNHLFDDQWLYLQSPGIQSGRLTNFNNWTSQVDEKPATTILAVELWCSKDDELWSADETKLIECCTKELRNIGLLGDDRVLDGHVKRIARSYPVYQRGYQEHIARIQRYLASLSGLSLIGRYGAFKYNNQDHSILMGLLAAENILAGAGHDLWEINADFDRYQEQSLITATGLVSV